MEEVSQQLCRCRIFLLHLWEPLEEVLQPQVVHQSSLICLFQPLLLYQLLLSLLEKFMHLRLLCKQVQVNHSLLRNMVNKRCLSNSSRSSHRWLIKWHLNKQHCLFVPSLFPPL